ncbi:MAG: MgtC/SapB family protein [Candidatus Omnitrophica bacterium]|nr:MgtC/SapB family protein [Candidatus Omnitrophota bacterium]
MLNEWVIIFRLVLSAILSGVIGFEREFHGRAAGFRTHILLSVGSALIMLTSIHIFDVYSGRVAIDPARLAAGVVTGIGFMGAGTIMRYKASVRGLTTATSLWVVAGIGLAVGSGLYFGAIATTLIAMIALMFFSKLEHVMIRKNWYKTIVIETQDGLEQLKRIRETLSEYGSEINDLEADRSKDGTHIILKFGLKLTSNLHNAQLIEAIARLEGVKNVKWEAD